MASAPQPALPLFYQGLEPVSTSLHADWKAKGLEDGTFFAKAHAVPLTVEEFVTAQRHFPIVFSVGPNPVPLALMGLNEGVNLFVDDEGRLREDIYVPAYVRRYPFMLARVSPDSDEMSLCFDPTAGALGAFDEGMPLFEDGKPTKSTQEILEFCERFEKAAMQTAAFVKELQDNKLLIDGELTIQLDGQDKPFVYRGFQMVSDEALRALRGDVLRKMEQSGMLPLIHAHSFSLSLVRELFARQYQEGKVPQPGEPATADA